MDARVRGPSQRLLLERSADRCSAQTATLQRRRRWGTSRRWRRRRRRQRWRRRRRQRRRRRRRLRRRRWARERKVERSASGDVMTLGGRKIARAHGGHQWWRRRCPWRRRRCPWRRRRRPGRRRGSKGTLVALACHVQAVTFRIRARVIRAVRAVPHEDVTSSAAELFPKLPPRHGRSEHLARAGHAGRAEGGQQRRVGVQVAQRLLRCPLRAATRRRRRRGRRRRSRWSGRRRRRWRRRKGLRWRRRRCGGSAAGRAVAVSEPAGSDTVDVAAIAVRVLAELVDAVLVLGARDRVRNEACRWAVVGAR